MKEYWIDTQDQFFPAIRHVSEAMYPEHVDLMTFSDAKRELIENAQSKIDFWKERIAEYRTIRKSDIRKAE